MATIDIAKLVIAAGNESKIPTLDAGQIVFTDDSEKILIGTSGGNKQVYPVSSGGTVTSVGVSVPAIFSVSGSPVTTSGTIAISAATQSARTFYAGPTTGAAAAPTFRALIGTDLTSSSGNSGAFITDDAGDIMWAAASDSTVLVGGDIPNFSQIQSGMVDPTHLDGDAGTYSMRTLGTGSKQACAGDDSRLSDARTPVGTALTSGRVWVGNGSNVAAAVAMSGDATLSNAGVLTIANDAVTYAKLQNVSAQYRLLGRQSVGAGDVEEITCTSPGLNIIAQPSFLAMRNAMGVMLPLDFGGRLSLSSTLAVPTSDITAATTLYYLPHTSEYLTLRDTTDNIFFRVSTSGGLSISLSGLTASRPYDVFVYPSGTYPTLELLAWTNTTTRATALSTIDGVLCKSGDASRLYLGTICITSTTGQCEDSLAKRFVWNCYNRVHRRFKVSDGTSHAYNNTTLRQWRATATNQIEWVCGLAEDVLQITTSCRCIQTSAGQNMFHGFGLDSTTAYHQDRVYGTSHAASIFIETSLTQYVDPSIGYHYAALLQESTATGTATFSVGRITGMYAM